MANSTGSNSAPLIAAAAPPVTVFNMREMRESLALAEQLAKASMSSNKGRSPQLHQLDANNNNEGEETPRTYVPPKQLLLYLVRYCHRSVFTFSSRRPDSIEREKEKKRGFAKTSVWLRQSAGARRLPPCIRIIS